MLILWDIDGTLLVTERSGVAAMQAAGAELFNPSFTTARVSYAGRLDPAIVEDLLIDNGVQVTRENLALFKACYRTKLTELLQQPGRARALPGVLELLDGISRRDEITQGLLTGNWEETGSLKLKAAGIDIDYFKLRIWGDDSPYQPPKREYLARVAMSRYSEVVCRCIDPKQVTVIGDTPHDIECAKINGCRAVGVATGLSSSKELYDAGADLAVDDLSDVYKMYHWLIGTV